MELRVLHYFLTVAREQSISGAAERLHLTQPTLSRQLKDLEDELGKQLLIRGSRRVTLTEDGKLLRKRAEEILQLVQKTEREVTRGGDAVTGEIAIGACEGSAQRDLARALCSLRRQHPGVCFRMTGGSRQALLEQLELGLVDFALIPGSAESARIQALPLGCGDPLGAVLPSDHPLSKRSAVTPADLLGEPLLLCQPISAELAAWFQSGAADLVPCMTCTQQRHAVLMAEAGAGCAILPASAADGAGSGLCFRPLDPPLSVRMALAWRRDQVFSPAAGALLALLQAQAM